MDPDVIKVLVGGGLRTGDFWFGGWHLDDMVKYLRDNDKGEGGSGEDGEGEGGGWRRRGSGVRRSRSKMMKLIVERFKLMKKWNRGCMRILKLKWSLYLVGDSVMKVVGGMKGLQVVEIVRCSRITGKGIYYLAGLRDLRVLVLEGMSGIEDVSGLEGMRELRKLRLRKLYVLQDEGFYCSGERGSSSNEGVKGVGGRGSGGREEGGESEDDERGLLGKLDKLEHLDLSFSFRLTMKTIKDVQYLQRLTHLDLTSTCCEAGPLFEVLQNLKRLQVLILSNTFHSLTKDYSPSDMSTPPLPTLPSLPSLTVLNLSHTGVTNSFLSSMSSCFPLLATLNLSYTPVTSSITHILPPRLQHLDVSHTTVRPVNLPATLLTLNLTSTPLNPSSIATLPASLTHLNLSYIFMSPSDVFNNLPLLPRLQSFTFSPTHPAYPPTSIAEFLQNHPGIEHLEITTTPLLKSSFSIPPIPIPRRQQQLERLALLHQQQEESDKSSKTMITELLPREVHYQAKDLSHLNLAGCEITNEKLKTIIRLVPNIKELNISQNPIDNTGLRLLRRLKSLKEVNLGYTKVTQKGIGELISWGICCVGIVGIRVERGVLEGWKRSGALVLGSRDTC